MEYTMRQYGLRILVGDITDELSERLERCTDLKEVYDIILMEIADDLADYVIHLDTVVKLKIEKEDSLHTNN